MKTLTLAFTFLMFTSTLAHADTVLSCKKRNPWVYTSYDWAEIEQNADGTLTFNYGNGIDDQMLEVLFSTPVVKNADGSYQYPGSDYAFTASVDSRSKLSFKLTAGNRTQKRSGYQCQ